MPAKKKVRQVKSSSKPVQKKDTPKPPERLVVYEQIVRLRISLQNLNEIGVFVPGRTLHAESQSALLKEAISNLEEILDCQENYWSTLRGD